MVFEGCSRKSVDVCLSVVAKCAEAGAEAEAVKCQGRLGQAGQLEGPSCRGVRGGQVGCGRGEQEDRKQEEQGWRGRGKFLLRVVTGRVFSYVWYLIVFSLTCGV